jgi:hypothetical protein
MNDQMKVILKYTIAILCFFILSCDSDKTVEIPDIDENITACGIHQPHKNLPWLRELIRKAETDKTGNYWGAVWLENYMGQDIFVTNMMLGSGGVLYWFFDCSGSHLISRNGEGYCPSEFVGDQHFFVEDEENFLSFMLNMKLDVVIYSTIPLN